MGIPLLIGIIFFICRYLFNRLVDSRIRNYQNDLISKHFNEVENVYKQMRGWRHDYHNHIQMMKAYLSLGRYEDMDRYLNELDKDLTNIDTVIKTGNIMVDAI
jgi:sensor histidine kinase regulating citrate/malate metabolism